MRYVCSVAEPPSDRRALSHGTPGAALCRGAAPLRHGHRARQRVVGSDRCAMCACADRFRPSELPSDRQALSQRTPGAALCRGAAPPRHGHRTRQRVVGIDRCAMCAVC